MSEMGEGEVLNSERDDVRDGSTFDDARRRADAQTRAGLGRETNFRCAAALADMQYAIWSTVARGSRTCRHSDSP